MVFIRGGGIIEVLRYIVGLYVSSFQNGLHHLSAPSGPYFIATDVPGFIPKCIGNPMIQTTKWPISAQIDEIFFFLDGCLFSRIYFFNRKFHWIIYGGDFRNLYSLISACAFMRETGACAFNRTVKYLKNTRNFSLFRVKAHALVCRGMG